MRSASGRYASYWNAFLLPSATVVAERLCFHKHLSFCPHGELYTPLGRYPPPLPLGRTPPGRPPPPPRRPLQRTVRIPLECILAMYYFCMGMARPPLAIKGPGAVNKILWHCTRLHYQFQPSDWQRLGLDFQDTNY